MTQPSISVVSLNVNGIRDPKRRELLFGYLNRNHFDIAFLQDTRILNKRECLRWNTESRCRGFWSVGDIYSRGVGILIRASDKFEKISFDVDFEGRVCVCDLTYNGTNLRLISIYAPAVGSKRLAFLSQLDRYLLTSRKLILGGDFNCVLDLSLDRQGGNPSNGGTGSRELKRLLDKYNLRDVWRQQHPLLKTCTWANKDRSIMSRLDKFYISSCLLTDCRATSGIKPCHLSDHDLIYLQLENLDRVVMWGRGIWKMNVSLLGQEKLRKKIISFWTNWSQTKCLYSDEGKWWDDGKDEVKAMIMDYSISVSRQAKEKRVHLMNKFHRFTQKFDLSPSETEQLQRVRADLLALDQEFLEGAKVRSRVRILNNNERPSRFFFHRERTNAAKKLVTAVRTNHGRVTDSEGIMKEQVQFYENLYAERLVDSYVQDEVLLSITRMLSEEEKISLESFLSEEECFAALQSMPSHRTPGSDGLPKEFYVSFWSTIKCDYVSMVNSCLGKGELPLSLRRAIITLIFKKDDPDELKNWRPISLLNVDYKIIAKVISRRLRAVMPSLIHPDQTCGVSGRSSEDNATLFRDITEYVNANNLKCAFIALDQEKAFDSVDWTFMNKVLQRMNFGPLICGIINCLYTNIQSAVLSNGSLSRYFDVHRGVRQGCPLSPLLFVLVSECFGEMIRSCKEIRGFRLPGGREIKISQYADDNTCLVVDDHSLFQVLETFDRYGRASGAKLNRTKSKGLWLGRWKERTDSPGGLKWSNTAIRIVGYYFGDESAFALTWDAGTKKFHDTLAEWRYRTLTLQGKCLVVNFLAASAVWHLARIYPPGREIIEQLRKAMWQFIWSYKTQRVRQEVCISELDAGGLKALDIDIKSKCLLIPRLFRFFDGTVAPWKDMMRYYIGRAIGVNDNSRPNSEFPSPFYHFLLSVIREFNVDFSVPRSTRCYYALAIWDKVAPVRPTCQIKWDSVFRGLNWKEIWSRVHSGLEDPTLRDFLWRSVHLVLSVNTILNGWNHRIPATCSRCNGRREDMSHALVLCPFVQDLWEYVLTVCNAIKPEVRSLTERNIILGDVGSGPSGVLVRYLVSVGKFAAWKERNSYQFASEKVQALCYFKSYVAGRLRADFSRLKLEKFRTIWCINNVLARVVNTKLVCLL